MVKQWSLERTAIYHHYNNITLMQEDSHWFRGGLTNPDLKSLAMELGGKEGVVDIGCGPGLIAIELSPVVKKYVGIEINDTCLKSCNQVLEENQIPNAVFLKQDIELEWTNEFKDEIEDCNICYLGSTLCMLEDPKSVLLNLIDNFEYIYADRLNYGTNTIKEYNHWAGMDKESVHWRLSDDFFSDITNDDRVKELTRPSNNSILIKKD
jgi:SAM-dependent methyltransferase